MLLDISCHAKGLSSDHLVNAFTILVNVCIIPVNICIIPVDVRIASVNILPVFLSTVLSPPAD